MHIKFLSDSLDPDGCLLIIVFILRTLLTFRERAYIVDSDQERHDTYCVYFSVPGVCGIQCRSHEQLAMIALGFTEVSSELKAFIS